MGFAIFMAGWLGRGLRIAAGVALIVYGLSLGGTTGNIVAAVGLLPILAGVLNLCLIAPLIGAPLRGSTCLATRSARV